MIVKDMPESQRRAPREQEPGYRTTGQDLRDLLDGNYRSEEEMNGAPPPRPPSPRSSRRDDRGYPSDYDPRTAEMPRREPY